MARCKPPVVITANCLRSGAVLYVGTDRRWVTSLSEAQRFDVLAEAEHALVAVDDASLVIAPYLAEIKGSDVIEPAHYREQIRASGPGVYAHESGSV